MTKSTTSYRLSDMAKAQIEALVQALGVSRTELLTLAVDRMYQQEIVAKQGKGAIVTGKQETEYDRGYGNGLLDAANEMPWKSINKVLNLALSFTPPHVQNNQVEAKALKEVAAFVREREIDGELS